MVGVHQGVEGTKEGHECEEDLAGEVVVAMEGRKQGS